MLKSGVLTGGELFTEHKRSRSTARTARHHLPGGSCSTPAEEKTNETAPLEKPSGGTTSDQRPADPFGVSLTPLVTNVLL